MWGGCKTNGSLTGQKKYFREKMLVPHKSYLWKELQYSHTQRLNFKVAPAAY